MLLVGANFSLLRQHNVLASTYKSLYRVKAFKMTQTQNAAERGSTFDTALSVLHTCLLYSFTFYRLGARLAKQHISFFSLIIKHSQMF